MTELTKAKNICIHDGCTKRCTFGLPNSIAEYCKSHIPDERYIDVKHKRCKYPDCKKIPNFGLEETMIAEYCKSHIPNEMYVNVKVKYVSIPTVKKYRFMD